MFRRKTGSHTLVVRDVFVSGWTVGVDDSCPNFSVKVDFGELLWALTETWSRWSPDPLLRRTSLDRVNSCEVELDCCDVQ